jgi:hypothetical protein
MQRSYVATTTIDFMDFHFYVRPGDVLVHDTGNHNRLTVYRNGQIVKVVKQEPLGIGVFLKNKFIEPVLDTPAVALVPPPAPQSTPVVAETPVAASEPSKEDKDRELKRRKAHPIELSADEVPYRLKQVLLELKPKPVEEPVETEK